MRARRIAALFVETGGCYTGLPDVDAYDSQRDARFYRGPHRVIAHPPCQRWGRFWHGAPNKPHQYRLGDDDGCFAAALRALVLNGGVLEHPAYSHAWEVFNLPKPPRDGWRLSGTFAVCQVEQGHYGHLARKPTWLIACGDVVLPELVWGPSEQRLPDYAVERYGYAKARRIGVMAAIGGKDKTRIRNATPIRFRDVLISIARGAA